MGSFLELLLLASMPVIKFLLIMVLGVFLALNRIHILGHTARHHLNQLVFYVFSPALVAGNLAKTITLESFLTMWFMPINVLLTFVIGSALGWVLVKLTRAPKHIKGIVISTCSAGNLGAIPIIVVTAICKQKGSPFGAADVCTQYGLAYASLSLAIGAIYIWLYIYNIIRITTEKEGEYTNANGRGGIDKQPADGDALVNIPETEHFGATKFTDALPANQLSNYSSEEHDDKTSVDAPERLPSTRQSVAAPTDRLTNSTKFMIAVAFKIRQSLRNACKNINLKAILAPSTIAAVTGFFIGMIPPFRKLLFSDDAPLLVVGDTVSMIGDAAIPAMTLMLGANLLKGLKGSGVKLTIILGIIVVRSICLPLMGVLMVKGAIRAGFVQSHDLLFQFVILLQYCLPPALNIGTITQLFGEGESECAVVMLWTYAAAPVTITLWSTFFLWLISHQ